MQLLLLVRHFTHTSHHVVDAVSKEDLEIALRALPQGAFSLDHPLFACHGCSSHRSHEFIVVDLSKTDVFVLDGKMVTFPPSRPPEKIQFDRSLLIGLTETAEANAATRIKTT